MADKKTQGFKLEDFTEMLSRFDDDKYQIGTEEEALHTLVKDFTEDDWNKWNTTEAKLFSHSWQTWDNARRSVEEAEPAGWVRVIVFSKLGNPAAPSYNAHVWNAPDNLDKEFEAEMQSSGWVRCVYDTDTERNSYFWTDYRKVAGENLKGECLGHVFQGEAVVYK